MILDDVDNWICFWNVIDYTIRTITKIALSAF